MEAVRSRAALRFLLVLADCTIGVPHSSNTSNASWRPGLGAAHASLTPSVPRCPDRRPTKFPSMALVLRQLTGDRKGLGPLAEWLADLMARASPCRSSS